MRMRRPLLAGCAFSCAAVVLTTALAACGNPSLAGHNLTQQHGAEVVVADPPSMTTKHVKPPRATEANPAGFGSEYRFDSGLVVMVGVPKSFQPGPGAYPRTTRAAALSIALRNDGDVPYQLSSFSVQALVNDKETQQVVDPTQGYTGIQDADQDLAPRQTVRMTLAFAVLDESCMLRLVLRPTAGAPAVAVYRGAV